MKSNKNSSPHISRDLAELISEYSTFSTADVMGMIECLVQRVPSLLMDGHNVRLDGFGTFSLHVTGIGQDHPEEVTKRDITGIRMGYLPDKLIKRKLKQTKFNKAT